MWSDAKGDCLIAEADGKMLFGASKAGVTAMCAHPDDEEAWVGYDDGKMRVFARVDGAVKNDMQRHQKTVSCLTVMGDHIWSGSADHSLVAWSIKSKTPVFELPQQGGFVRATVRVGWSLWVLTNKVGLGSADRFGFSRSKKNGTERDEPAGALM